MADDKDKGADEIAELKASIEKLEAKNRELIGEVRKAKGSTNEEAARLAEELDNVKAENIKLSTAAKKATDEKAKVEKELSDALNSERGAVSKLVLDNGLTEALVKAGVKPELMSAAKALLREKGVLSVESEGEVRRAIAKIKKDGKDISSSLEDYVTKDFAVSDEGKAFISATANAGAGAQGGKGGQASAKTMKRDEFLRMSPTDQMAKIKEGVKPID